MSSPFLQHTVRFPRVPQICAVVIMCGTTAGVLASTTAPAASDQEPVSASAAPQDGVMWLVFWALMEALEEVLKEPDPMPQMDENTEAANVLMAANQTSRYDQAGLKANLSAAEKEQGVADCEALRTEILAYPVQFSDSEWDTYLDTLDAIEEELEG